MMNSVVLPVAILGLTVLLYRLCQRRKNFPPGPRGWPIIGNMFLMYNNQRFHLTMDQLYKKYGPIIGLEFCGYPTVVLSETDVLKQVLIDNGELSSDRLSFLPRLKRTKGTFFSYNYGPDFKRLKKMALSSLRDLGLGSKVLEGKIHDEVHLMMEIVRKNVGCPLNVDNLVNKLTANVLCSLLFGTRYSNDDQELFSLVADIRFFAQSTAINNPAFMASEFFLRIIHFVSPTNQQRTEHILNMKNFGKAQIDEHLKVGREVDNKNDVLDMLIVAGATRQELEDLFSALIIAGFETTGTTLLWSVLLMTKYPNVQEKCRQEILKVIETDRLPFMSDRRMLPYVDATLKEIQRFATLVPLGIPHSLNTDLWVNGYHLPKRTVIFTNLYSVHMNEKYWDEPKCFKPERFLDQEGNLLSVSENLMPFGIGSRSCLGENLAKTELFLIFTSLLQNFKFRVNDPGSVPHPDEISVGATLGAPSFAVDFSLV